jgi:hypothetical protein
MKRTTWIIQLAALSIAVVLALVMVFKRASAQPVPAKPAMAGARSGPVVDAGAPAGSAAVAPDPTPAPAPEAGDKEDQLADTVVPDGGGVPIHTEGEFRSPFANPKWGTPTTVRVGLVLNDVTDYDIMKGTFNADFYLSMTSDKEMPSMDLIFPNGKTDDKEVIADKPTFKLFRFTGEFTSPPDLRRYPFDKQELSIQIEENTEGIDQIDLVPDKTHTHLEAGFEVIGWDVSDLDATNVVHNFPDRFDHDDLYYGRYEFRLGIERYGTSALFTVFVPAFVIVLITLMGQWMPFASMDIRSNAGAPMLAAAVLFHFALMQSLPAVSYLTRADKLMLGVYGSLLMCMFSTWWFFLVREENHNKVFMLGKWLIPPICAVLMVTACIV